MSRIGKLPITVPAGVTVSIEGNTVAVKGPKGELTRTFLPQITIEMEGDAIKVTRHDDEPANRAAHGLTRALLQNMVTGVSEGFTRNLELIGVGYRAAKNGNKLVLNVGYSNPVEMEPPASVQVEVPAATKISLTGYDKEELGMFAAQVRAVRPPEPYKGKGIRYEGEYVRRKAGKAGIKK